MQSDPFMDAARARRQAPARAWRAGPTGRSTPGSALWGLPTSRDVSALVNQVAALERQLRELRPRSSRAADGAEPDRAPAAARPQRRRVPGGTEPPAVATTPRDLVCSATRPGCGATAATRAGIRPPILIVHSLVCKSYILDLLPEQQHDRLPARRGLRRVPARLGCRRRRRTRENTLETYVDRLHPRGDGRGGRGVGRRGDRPSSATASAACSRCCSRPATPSCRSATWSR